MSFPAGTTSRITSREDDFTRTLVFDAASAGPSGPMSMTSPDFA
jgi:hypothetical protein